MDATVFWLVSGVLMGPKRISHSSRVSLTFITCMCGEVMKRIQEAWQLMNW